MSSSPYPQQQPEQPNSQPWPHANMPPEALAEWEEFKRRGYPKQDHDPATGETFETWPEGIVLNPDHPLYEYLPETARPENWREKEFIKGQPGVWPRFQ